MKRCILPHSHLFAKSMSYPARHMAVAPPDHKGRFPIRDAGALMEEPAIRRAARSRLLSQTPCAFSSDVLGRSLSVINRATAFTWRTGPGIGLIVLRSPSLNWSDLLVRIVIATKSSLSYPPSRMSDIRSFSISPILRRKKIPIPSWCTSLFVACWRCHFVSNWHTPTQSYPS